MFWHLLTYFVESVFVCVCIQKCATEFTADLNNTDPDGESLKTRPMKTAPLLCGSVQHGPLPRANAAGLTSRHKLTHTHSPHLHRPSACGNSVDGDIIIPRPLTNITEQSGNVVPGNNNITTSTVVLLSLLYYSSHAHTGQIEAKQLCAL